MLGCVFGHIQSITNVWLTLQVHDHAAEETCVSVDSFCAVIHAEFSQMIEVTERNKHQSQLNNYSEQESKLRLQHKLKLVFHFLSSLDMKRLVSEQTDTGSHLDFGV